MNALFPSLAPDFSTYAEEESRAQRIQDREDELWSDAAILAEFLLNTRNGPLDNNEAGSEFFRIAQDWKRTPPQDERGRAALERAMGRVAANALDSFVRESATSWADSP